MKFSGAIQNVSLQQTSKRVRRPEKLLSVLGEGYTSSSLCTFYHFISSHMFSSALV
jgi:hypothetical protein